MLSLPLSLKEDWGGGLRKEWRSVSERLGKTGQDKADKLEVYLNCS